MKWKRKLKIIHCHHFLDAGLDNIIHSLSLSKQFRIKPMLSVNTYQPFIEYSPGCMIEGFVSTALGAVI